MRTRCDLLFESTSVHVANSPRRIFSVANALAHDNMKTYCGFIAVTTEEPGHG
jgi:hypothetical protein